MDGEVATLEIPGCTFNQPARDVASSVSTYEAGMDYEITPEGVKDKLDAGEEFTLLDVREPWEFETAHMAGAKMIPMGDVPARAHQELDPEDHIVVVCHHGVRSMNVTAWLRQQGFEKAQSMRGGIDAWSRRVDGKVPVY
jgi:rhodanese-related sulfurtransferase